MQNNYGGSFSKGAIQRRLSGSKGGGAIIKKAKSPHKGLQVGQNKRSSKPSGGSAMVKRKDGSYGFPR